MRSKTYIFMVNALAFIIAFSVQMILAWLVFPHFTFIKMFPFAIQAAFGIALFLAMILIFNFIYDLVVKNVLKEKVVLQKKKKVKTPTRVFYEKWWQRGKYANYRLRVKNESSRKALGNHIRFGHHRI